MKRHRHLKISEPAKLPTRHGNWTITAFHDSDEPDERSTHLAVTYGDVAGKRGVLARVHSSCMTSEVLGSLRCDCAQQLDLAMSRIAKSGAGVIVYLRHEGRGIGLFNKIRAYHLQDHGLDTVEANKKLGLPIDSREYHAAAAILKELGVLSVRLLTNNPKKYSALKRAGVRVASRVPIRIRAGRHNKKYLNAKRRLLKHRL